MILERFKIIIKHIDLKQEDLSSKLEMSLYDLRNILTRKKKITPELALLMEDKFKINPCWLFFGKGKMISEIEDEIDLDKIKQEVQELFIKLDNIESNMKK